MESILDLAQTTPLLLLLLPLHAACMACMHTCPPGCHIPYSVLMALAKHAPIIAPSPTPVLYIPLLSHLSHHAVALSGDAAHDSMRGISTPKSECDSDLQWLRVRFKAQE